MLLYLTETGWRVGAPAAVLATAEDARPDQPVAGRAAEHGTAAAAQVYRRQQHVRVVQRQQRTLHRVALRQRARPPA